ncbi:DUF445 family protein [Alkaliphilus sp. MSJ-5]|uniref:DUF445 family protein n=1 Tax=Alkaliphilus flagellatus TaxID=2841507 RepID=A0ABS6G3F0_9FIRM|nr:DUF445 family protein [Alkaliphilus flagellatus]MBU5677016.1 DUF445 family protein [Alkaliphilus flagellatus]
MVVQLLILAIIGGVIGWITNLLAIKMLFRPFQPISIPLINFKIQGLIPKRKAEIARSIGQTVETELLSIEEIIDKLVKSNNKDEILILLKNKITVIVANHLPSIIPSTFKGMISKYINDVIDEEGDKIITEAIEKMIEKATTSIELSKMIEDKVNEFEMEELERIVVNIAKTELKHIEVLGGILGFIIGIFQGIIILLF